MIGALGFVLYESSKHIKPLLAKFARLQSQLECTQSALLLARSNKYTPADMVGHPAPCSSSSAPLAAPPSGQHRAAAG